MKSRYTLPVFCALILAFGLTATSAAQAPREPPEMGQRMIGHIAERLGLNESEAEQLGEIMRKHREGVAPTMDELREARRTLHDQIAEETFDETAIRGRAAQVAELEADFAVARALHHQEMRSVLSAEQFERFQTMRQRRGRGPMGDHPGPGNHRGGQRHRR